MTHKHSWWHNVIGFQIKTEMAHTLGIDVDKTKLYIDRCYIFSLVTIDVIFLVQCSLAPFCFFRFLWFLICFWLFSVKPLDPNRLKPHVHENFLAQLSLLCY